MKVTLTATSEASGAIYAKEFPGVTNGKQLRKLQNKLSEGLNHFGDVHDQHKAKGVDVSSLPQDGVVIRLDTGNPKIYNVAAFTIPVDPKFGGTKLVADALDKFTKGF